MNKVQNFDGTLVINIGQKDGENTTYFRYTVEGVNRLTLNQLAGTITKAVFQLYGDQKQTGVRLLKANKPVLLHITDNSKHVIADSVYIKKEFAAKLNLLSKDRFGRIMYNGLKAMRSITSLSTLNEVISDKAMTFIGQDGVIFEAETVEVAEQAS